MADWFRNWAWDDEIAAAFDARLARARGKAQYLNIQAYTLLATRPDVAAGLARRAIAIGDPAETARGGLYLGTALAIAGDLDGAIEALEGSIEAQRIEPLHRTAAHLDQALLIALAERADLYDVALDRLAGESALPTGERDPTGLIAESLIRADRGEDMSDLAAAAVEFLSGGPDAESILPPYLLPAELRRRLKSAA